MASASGTRSWRPLRLSAVATLILLSIQAWTGDFVNIFVTTGPQQVGLSLGNFFQALIGGGTFLILHGLEGFLILISAVWVAYLSSSYDRRSVQIAALLGLTSVLVAGIGGFYFVLSGFSDGGDSMQMGGSFLGSYAMYFLVLYYSK